jgi:uncharacterized membrane protein YcaP (DUF421 family)
MTPRTVLPYAVTLMLTSLASKRFLSQETAFDAIVGSMLARS